MSDDSCPAIDLAAGVKRLEGDNDFFCDLLRMFLEDGPKRLRTLQSCLESGDVEGAAKAAHSLKGMSATIAATHLSQTASEMEALLNKGQQDEARAKIDCLNGQMEQVLAAARTHCDS